MPVKPSRPACLFWGGSLLVNGLRAAAGIDLYSKLFNGFCILIWGFVFVYAKYRAIMYSREKAKQEWQKKRARAAQEACGDMHPYD